MTEFGFLFYVVETNVTLMASYTHEELELSQKHEDMWVLSVCSWV